MSVAEAAPARPHRWLTTLEKAPDRELDALLRGIRLIPPYQRADAGDILSTLFAATPADDPLRAKLDAALRDWLSARAAEGPEERARYGLNRYVRELTEALSIVYRLDLPQSEALLSENYFAYRQWLAPLYLGVGFDPLRQFLRALAQRQPDARFKRVWLDLCAGAGTRYPEGYLDIGLIGLRRMGGKAADAGSEILIGLKEWGRTLEDTKADKQRFLQEWHAIQALYPRQLKHWRKYVRPILEANAEEPFAAWWGADVFGANRSADTHSTWHAELPSKYEREDLQRRIEEDWSKSLRSEVQVLFARYRRYSDATGDFYNLVRSASTIGTSLLDKAPDLSLDLVRIAREWEPDNPFLWTLWAQALAALGWRDLAACVLWEAIRRFPDDDVSRTALAGLLARTGRVAEAEALYRETAARFPRDPVCRNALGLLLINLGRWPEAEPLLRELQALGTAKAGREIAELGAALKRAKAGEAVLPPAEDHPAGLAEAAVEPQAAVRAEVVPLRSGATVTQADFRLGNALDILPEGVRKPLRAEARADLERVIAAEPNNAHARLVQFDRVGMDRDRAEGLLAGLPRLYPFALAIARRYGDTAALRRLIERFPEHATITRLALVEAAEADETDRAALSTWLSGVLPKTAPPIETYVHGAVRQELGAETVAGLGPDELAARLAERRDRLTDTLDTAVRMPEDCAA